MLYVVNLHLITHLLKRIGILIRAVVMYTRLSPTNGENRHGERGIFIFAYKVTKKNAHLQEQGVEFWKNGGEK